MARGLDHIVHAVRDLDAAAAFYRAAGFIVGARNIHPWGTHNHVVQMPGFFIEVLTVGDDARLHTAAAGGDPLANAFGMFQRDRLREAQGFSMLIGESTDIAADQAALAQSGFSTSPVLPFSRVATLPGGEQATVGFSLAFARDPLSPRTGFALCQQHNPAAFWKPDYQTHANGAVGVNGVVLVADNPTDHHVFLSAWSGVRELHATSAGLTVRTPRGDVDILTPVAMRDRFGIDRTVAGEEASLVALRLGVKDLTQTERLLSATQEIAKHRDALVVSASGATLIFETCNEQ